MPAVDVPPDLDRVFAEARRTAAARMLAIVTPGRGIFQVPIPGGSAGDPAPLRELLRSAGPLDIAVVSYTALDAMEKDLAKCIPFLGFLFGFASLGHRVVVFEGHASAFAAGVRGADLLLMDSGMAPFAPDAWMALAFAGVRAGGRVLLHDRRAYSLKELLPKPGAPPELDFSPRMPLVAASADLPAVFADARRRAQHRLALVLPDRRILELEVPPLESVRSSPAFKLIQSLAPPDAGSQVAVIACTVPELVAASLPRAIPIINFLRGIAALGHRLTIFEGHPSALAAGADGADTLIVDGGMEPLLDEKWAVIAAGAMRKPRILVVTRNGLVIQLGHKS